QREIFAKTFAPRLRTYAREPLVTLRRQDRIRGTGGGAAELVRRNGLHIHTRSFGDCAGEVVPRALFFIRVMRDAARIELREPDDRVREMRRIRRTSALIVDNAQRVRALANLIANRFDEIRTVHAKEPRCAHDEMFLSVRGCELAEEFRAAVGGK